MGVFARAMVRSYPVAGQERLRNLRRQRAAKNRTSQEMNSWPTADHEGYILDSRLLGALAGSKKHLEWSLKILKSTLFLVIKYEGSIGLLYL